MTEMESRSGTIIGYDPGGAGAHGVAKLLVDCGQAVSVTTDTTGTTEQVIRIVEGITGLMALGIDTLTCWSTTLPNRPRSSTAPRMAKRRKPTTPWNGWPLLPCPVPERRKQTIRYYGAYANSVRGKQRKRQEVEPIPTVLEPVISSEAFRRNWARMIQKV